MSKSGAGRLYQSVRWCARGATNAQHPARKRRWRRQRAIGRDGFPKTRGARLAQIWSQMSLSACHLNHSDRQLNHSDRQLNHSDDKLEHSDRDLDRSDYKLNRSDCDLVDPDGDLNASDRKLNEPSCTTKPPSCSTGPPVWLNERPGEGELHQATGDQRLGVPVTGRGCGAETAACRVI